MAFGKSTKASPRRCPRASSSPPTPRPAPRCGPARSSTWWSRRAAEPIPVGSWAGKSADDAEQALEARGLKVDVSQQYSDSVPEGIVISQDPKAGTLFKGDTVTLLVSLGPQLVEVPNVVASGVDDATATLQAAGFAVEVAGGPRLPRPGLRLLDGPRRRHRAAHRLDGHPLPRVTPAATTRRGSLLATGALLLTTASWGSTFFLIKDLLERVPTLDFLAVRFAIAGLVMFAVAHRAVLALPREVLRRAVLVGGIYGVAQILQTAGPRAHRGQRVRLHHRDVRRVHAAARGGAAQDGITPLTWGAVALATAGLGVLTLDGFSVGYGEALTLVAAVLYALHIVALGAWSTAREALGMSVVQLLVIAVICLVATAPDGVVLPDQGRDWAADRLHGAGRRRARARSRQTWAQSQLSPTRTAIIMSMEPVFAALFAVLLGGEDLTSRMLLGGAMVLAAMLVVEVGPRRQIEGEVQHLTV